MSKQKMQAFLEKQDFFAGLEQEYLEFLAENAEEQEVAADEVLFRYDDKAGNFYVVVEGDITLEVAALEGPSLKLQEVGPGEVIGWSWLIPPYRWNFQGRAQKATTVYAFDGKAIRKRCEEDCDFGYAVLKRFSELMSARLAFARQRMIDVWQVRGFA